jgi:hypothetical protein
LEPENIGFLVFLIFGNHKGVPMSESHAYKEVCQAILALRTFTVEEIVTYLQHSLQKGVEDIRNDVLIVIRKIKRSDPCALGKPVSSPPEGGYKYSVSEEAKGIIMQMIQT